MGEKYLPDFRPGFRVLGIRSQNPVPTGTSTSRPPDGHSRTGADLCQFVFVPCLQHPLLAFSSIFQGNGIRMISSSIYLAEITSWHLLTNNSYDTQYFVQSKCSTESVFNGIVCKTSNAIHMQYMQYMRKIMAFSQNNNF